MRTFTFTQGPSAKFWHIDRAGKKFTVAFGRAGTKGQVQTKDFSTAAKAKQAHDKLIEEKLAKGYVETTDQKKAAPAPTQLALEQALVEDPDDLGAHSAYADYLSEQGDPRGEFVQVQLALEDPRRTPRERKALQQRERELLKLHQREWLGDLAGPLLDVEKNAEHGLNRGTWKGGPKFQFARGWLDVLHIAQLGIDLATALAPASELRLLRRLIVERVRDRSDELGEYGDYALEEADPLVVKKRRKLLKDVPRRLAEPGLHPLLDANWLGNIRVFQLGETYDTYSNCHIQGELAADLVKKMPRLEELYLMAREVDTDKLFGMKLDCLRILNVDHITNYPLQKLASNKSLGRLTHLLLHPHALEYGDSPYINVPGARAIFRSPHLTSLKHLRLRLSDLGDKGCEEIVKSGILRRLKVLDLRHGIITDAGAHTLAACPELASLEELDLTGNCLTRGGIRKLKGTGVRVVAPQQNEPPGEDVFYEGDIE